MLNRIIIIIIYTNNNFFKFYNEIREEENK